MAKSRKSNKVNRRVNHNKNAKLLLVEAPSQQPIEHAPENPMKNKYGLIGVVLIILLGFVILNSFVDDKRFLRRK
jgi:hypothetical protein